MRTPIPFLLPNGEYVDLSRVKSITLEVDSIPNESTQITKVLFDTDNHDVIAYDAISHERAKRLVKEAYDVVALYDM